MSAKRVPSSNFHSNVAATGIGSEMPVDSMTIWSYLPERANAPTPSTRSSRNVQQMQPLDSSTNRSSPRVRCEPAAMSSASTLTSGKSLTMTASLRPPRLASKWLSSVVFPEPRNPDRTVTGVRLRLSADGEAGC